MFQYPKCKIATGMLRTLLLLVILAAPKNIHSWDIAVASDGGLSLLALNGSLESTYFQHETGINALAFDPVTERFYIGDTQHSNTSIFMFDMKLNTTVSLVPKLKFDVQCLVMDSETRYLYWTDGNGASIWKRSVKTVNLNDTVERVLYLPGQVPMGIAVSTCHSGIFWANNNHTSPSIDRTDLYGKSHTKIVTRDLFQPLGLTIDDAYGKVYWTDDRPGIYYRIERCSIDGSDRELVLQKTNQEPFAVAIAGYTIFWTDSSGNKVWTLSGDMTFPNHTNARLVPDTFYNFDRNRPTGIAVRRNASQSCEPIKILRTVEVLDEFPYEQSSNFDKSTDFCFNLGELVRGACRCKRGFIGQRCEVPVCHNHCLNEGVCYLDRQGYPDCRCLPGYEGRRCERDVCDDYCLAGGRCFVEGGQPTCTCAEGSSGRRCEVSAKLAVAATSSYEIPIFAALGAVACTLLVIVFILTWRVIALKRHPRVKKRYIVNKGRRAPTPLTSRPPASPVVEQCEITIENCCNMNICETPCFEPNLRTTKPSSNKKTEDRRKLLKNMEEDTCGSD